MLNDIKNTAKHSIVYAIGNMGVKFVGFLLIPFYTNTTLLSTTEYGALAVLEASLQMLVGVLAFAMTSSLSRWYWDKNYIKEQKSIFFTSFLFLLVVLLPTIYSLSIYSEQFSNLLFKTSSYSYIVKLTILTAGFQILNNLILTLLRLKSKSTIYVGIQLIKLISLLGLVIWGLNYNKLGLKAVWQAMFLSEAFAFILLSPVLIKNSALKIKLSVLHEMLAYGLPLMLASLSSVILSVTDRYMLNSMQGLERTAIYSLGLRISNTIKMLITLSLSLALTPLQMKKIGEKGSELFFSKILKYSSFLFSIALLALSLFSLEILKVISNSPIYWEANSIIVIITFALLFGQIKNNALIGITIKKRTKITGTLVFITSLLNVGLNFILIPIWDIYGAAFATFFSQLFFLIAIYIAAQKLYFIPYELARIVKAIIILGLFVIVGLLLSELYLPLRLGLKIILLITYPFVLALFNYYDETEKQKLLELYKTWKNPKKFKNNIQRFLK